jgi:translation initiation factor SUI1
MDKLLNLGGTTATLPDPVRAPGPGTGKIHIRIQQMGKKWITTVEGLDSDLDQQRIARAIKRAFQCAASVHRDEETELEYIKLQGNHRDAVVRWLVEQEVISERERKERVVLHGA